MLPVELLKLWDRDWDCGGCAHEYYALANNTPCNKCLDAYYDGKDKENFAHTLLVPVLKQAILDINKATKKSLVEP